MTIKKDEAPASDMKAVPKESTSAEWSEKEHIAESTIAAAQKLLEAAGSIELAQQALTTVAGRNNDHTVSSKPSAQ